MYSVLTLIWVAVIVVNQRPQLLHTRTVLRACRLESETFTFNITTKCMSLKITFKDRSIILPWQQQETRFLWGDRCQAPAFSCPPPSPEMQGQTGISKSPVKQEMCKSNQHCWWTLPSRCLAPPPSPGKATSPWLLLRRPAERSIVNTFSSDSTF